MSFYEDYHFISGYRISEESFEMFEKPCNIELSKEERAQYNNQPQNPTMSIPEKEKNLIDRAEKYKQYKNNFNQDNPNIDKDEF